MLPGSALAHRQNALTGTLFCFSAAVLDYVFLGELLTGIQLAGAALVLAGVTLVTLKSKVTPSQARVTSTQGNLVKDQ